MLVKTLSISAVATAENVEREIKVNPLAPPAGVAHLSPVAVALSATILEIGIVQVLA